MAASAGVVGAHLLDAVHALPGAHESEVVRAIALAPEYDAGTLLAAIALAFGVDRLLRRGRTAQAFLGLLVGQVALLALPEAMAHAQAGAAPAAWSTLGIEVALQVVVAAAVVALAAVADAALGRLALPNCWLGPVRELDPVRAAPARLSARPVQGVRGRGPPVSVIC